MVNSTADKTETLASTKINLADFGLDQIAYVRPAVIDDVPVWSIHNAAGAPVGAAPTREQAMGALLQHDLIPHSVH